MVVAVAVVHRKTKCLELVVEPLSMVYLSKLEEMQSQPTG
jgi:hypothetical protein